MTARLDTALTIGDLADAVRLSPSRLAHLFRRETGTSPAQYLHALRLDCARELLAATFLSVKEIAARVGISDQSHFSRDFRRRYGASPRQWRRMLGTAGRLTSVAAEREKANSAEGDSSFRHVMARSGR